MYNFDEIIDRRHTNAMNTDGFREYIFHADETMTFPYKDEEFIRMWVADMEFATPDVVIDAIRERLDKRIFGYSRVFEKGYYEAFSAWCQRRYGWSFPKEELVMSNGIIPALYELVEYITREDEKVLFLTPSYAYFKYAADFNHRECVCSDLTNEDGYYTVNWEDLADKAADPKTPLLILCNPHNPVGRVWTAEELSRIAAICEQNGVFVISDEVHCDHLRAGVRFTPYLTACGDKGKAISLVGINKSFNMAGLSCSNAVIQDEDLRREVLENYPMVMPSPFAIAGHIAAYTEGDEWMDQVCAYIDGNIRWALDFFAREMPKVKVGCPEGTYFLWLDFRGYGLSDEEVHKRIYQDANVFLQDGTVHDPEAGHCFQRMCVPCARSVLETACRRIRDAFSDID